MIGVSEDFSSSSPSLDGSRKSAEHTLGPSSDSPQQLAEHCLGIWMKIDMACAIKVDGWEVNSTERANYESDLKAESELVACAENSLSVVKIDKAVMNVNGLSIR